MRNELSCQRLSPKSKPSDMPCLKTKFFVGHSESDLARTSRLCIGFYMDAGAPKKTQPNISKDKTRFAANHD